MVTVTDMKIIIERWKKGTRPLKVHDMKSGQKVVGMLEKYDGTEFGLFDDPFEAAKFILLVGMLKEQDLNNHGPAVPDTIIPDLNKNRTIACNK